MPVTRTGTLDIGTLFAATTQSAAEFGLNTMQDILAADQEAHNALMRNALGEIAVIGTDRQRVVGSSNAGKLIKVDEYGRVPTQRSIPPDTVGFPLHKFQFAVGWTRDWEKEKTPADFATAQRDAQVGHRLGVLDEIKRAIYGVANYTFVDYMVDKLTLPSVKRLANADGAPIPYGPNGEVFDPTTHTHYTASATYLESNALAQIANVTEHGFTTDVRLYINQAQESAVRGFSTFVPLQDPRVAYTAPNQPTERLDIQAPANNRKIGILGAASVWVKPWILANYPFVFDAGAPVKPVYLRERVAGSMDLTVAATVSIHPLVAEYMESKFGVGVWGRLNGAVHYVGGGAYVVPTI